MQQLRGIVYFSGEVIFFPAAYVCIYHTWYRAFRHATHIAIYANLSYMAFEPFALPNICIQLCTRVSFAFLAQVIDCKC